MDFRRVAPAAAAGLATAAILVVTWTPVPGAGPQPAGLFWHGTLNLADVLRNLVLFSPLGASLWWRGVPPRRALALAALLSASIEIAQGGLPIAGRDASAVDLVANVAGAGIAIALLRAESKTLAVLFGAGAAVALASAGFLFAPAPTERRYFAHHVPDFANLAPYEGKVIDAAIDDVDLPVGWIDDSPRIRAALMRDHVLAVRARAGAAPPGRAALFMITDEGQNEIESLGPDRDDLLYRFRNRGYALGLEFARVRVPHGLHAVRAGDLLELRAERVGSDLCFTVDRSVNCGYGFSVGDGWLLIGLEGRVLGAWRAGLGVVWLACLFAPLGLFGRGNAVGSVAWAIAVASLWLAPMTGLRPTPVSQLAGAGAGVALGFAARRLAARLGRS